MQKNRKSYCKWKKLFCCIFSGFVSKLMGNKKILKKTNLLFFSKTNDLKFSSIIKKPLIFIKWALFALCTMKNTPRTLQTKEQLDQLNTLLAFKSSRNHHLNCVRSQPFLGKTIPIFFEIFISFSRACRTSLFFSLIQNLENNHIHKRHVD